MPKKPKFAGYKFEPFAGCRFCKGRPDGCIGCKKERELAEYNSPEAVAQREADAQAELNKHLVFSARFDNPAEMAVLQEHFNAQAVTEALDGSDITDEEVVADLKKGQLGGLSYTVSVEAMFQQLQSRDFESTATREDAERLVIQEHRYKMAAERGVQRLQTAVAGKPGSPDYKEPDADNSDL